MNKFKSYAVFFLLGIFAFACSEKKETYPALKLNGVYQLDSLYGLKFDLSGIVQINDSIYVVADKPWNKFLYGISFEDSSFMVDHKKNLRFSDKLDLEGIDHCNGTTFLVNERLGKIYSYATTDSLESIEINFDSLAMNPQNWGNSGWEGVAFDCSKNRLYLVKEREPRMIFVIDTEKWEIINHFNIPETESNDFSDAKFENGHLYLIERNGNYITKINPESQEVVAKFHFKNVASNSKGKLYGPTNFGMGEALLLTKDEIWVGLDNNGLKVTEFARKKYGMSGKSPVILKFERPIDF